LAKKSAAKYFFFACFSVQAFPGGQLGFAAFLMQRTLAIGKVE